MSTFLTPKGTELPLLALKGKQYLQVAYRLVWFREEKPDWSIETEVTFEDEKFVRSKATIRDQTGRIISTAHKVEHYAHFQDAMEKSETGAIGRALALCGYGTQFAPEILEGDEAGPNQRIVDAPTTSGSTGSGAPKEPGVAAIKPKVDAAGLLNHDPGDFKCAFGTKYKGLTIRQIDNLDIQALDGLMDFLIDKAEEKKQPLSKVHQDFINHGEAFLAMKNQKRA